MADTVSRVLPPGRWPTAEELAEWARSGGCVPTQAEQYAWLQTVLPLAVPPALPRVLHAQWNVESVRDFQKSHGMTDGTFDYVSPVRWYQFWRWHLIFNPSKAYLKSRLCEIELVEKVSDSMASELKESV